MPYQPISALTRREAIARLGTAITSLTVACSPVQVLMRMQPSDLEFDASRVERNLRTFALTIVPAASPSDPVLLRPFYDLDYPLAQYRELLEDDLARRVRSRSGVTQLDFLSQEQREALIREGVDGDPVIRPLYLGAIFMVEVAMLGGLYAGSGAVPLIGFEGEYQFRGLDALTYPEPERYLARPSSADGNPA